MDLVYDVTNARVRFSWPKSSIGLQLESKLLLSFLNADSLISMACRNGAKPDELSVQICATSTKRK